MTRLLLLVLVACGPKYPPDPGPDPGPEPIPNPDPMPDPVPNPDPDPEPEPPTASSNADFDVSVALADGSVATGQVVRVERSEDWYGDAGWTADPADLKLELESKGALAEIPWEEIAAIEIRYGAPAEISCAYDSSFDPLMYQCVLPTTSTAVTADGKRWTVADRHRWKFTFADDREVAFYVHKLPVREQDADSQGLDLTENPAMYEKLQARLAEERAVAPKKIELTR